MKHLALLPVLVVTVLLTGCRSIAVGEALNGYKTTLTPLVDKATKEQLEAAFGFPDRVNTLPGRELWHYFTLHHYYARDVFNPALGHNPVYDALTLEFDESGVLRAWSVKVAR